MQPLELGPQRERTAPFGLANRNCVRSEMKKPRYITVFMNGDGRTKIRYTIIIMNSVNSQPYGLSQGETNGSSESPTDGPRPDFHCQPEGQGILSNQYQ